MPSGRLNWKMVGWSPMSPILLFWPEADELDNLWKQMPFGCEAQFLLIPSCHRYFPHAYYLHYFRAFCKLKSWFCSSIHSSGDKGKISWDWKACLVSVYNLVHTGTAFMQEWPHTQGLSMKTWRKVETKHQTTTLVGKKEQNEKTGPK